MDIHDSGDLLAEYLTLDAKYQGKGSERPELVQSSLPGLNELLGGGVPIGYLIGIEGHLLTQSGKSGLCYLMAAALQERGGVLWIDTYEEFVPDHARNCGLDLNNVALCSVREASQALRCIERGVKTEGISCVVLDSIAGLLPKDIPGYHGPQVMRLFSERLKLIKGMAKKHKVTVLIINQYKDAFDQLVGGPATKCQPQVRLRVEDTFGVKHYGVREGLRSTVTSVKNHLTLPFKKWELNISYRSGPDRPLDVLVSAINKGIIQRQGSWYSYKDSSFQGIRELREGLDSQVDYLYELIAK
jgi:recombination protein RecA